VTHPTDRRMLASPPHRLLRRPRCRAGDTVGDRRGPISPRRASMARQARAGCTLRRCRSGRHLTPETGSHVWLCGCLGRGSSELETTAVNVSCKMIRRSLSI
jgi:hypothetical protein